MKTNAIVQALDLLKGDDSLMRADRVQQAVSLLETDPETAGEAADAVRAELAEISAAFDGVQKHFDAFFEHLEAKLRPLLVKLEEAAAKASDAAAAPAAPAPAQEVSNGEKAAV